MPHTTRQPRHAEMLQFQVLGDDLLIGGAPVARLAARVGSTPFYANDRQVIQRSVERLRRALPTQVMLHYAMKANPMPAVVQFVGALVDGVDVASAGELKVALDAAIDPEDISFAGPGKRDLELQQAVAAGVLINVESERELRRLAESSSRLGVTARVAVRVNPDFELKGSGMRMGGGPKQFGIDAEAVPTVLRRIGDLGLAFEGFHIFAGSQNLNHDYICEAQQKAFELAVRLADSAPCTPKYLNLGGGFGIPYFPGESRLNIDPIGENLDKLGAKLTQTLPEARLVIELGRYLVGEAGVFVTRIVDRKISRGQTFLVCDGGLNHHLSASGNFGQVIRKNYPTAIGNRMNTGRPTEVASVVGPLCTPLDIMADRMELPVADAGDLVVIFQSGAYGATASPHDFLSQGPLTEVLV